MTCEKCGTELPENTKSCPSCGAKVEETQAIKITGTITPANGQLISGTIKAAPGFPTSGEIHVVPDEN